MSQPLSPRPRVPLPVLRLTPTRVPAPADPSWANASIQIRISGEPLKLEISVPRGPARVRDLLPVFEGLTNAVMDVASRKIEREGKAISCQKGCGACCRQLVPISAAEAHHLSELVASMPQPRQTEIRRLFADARDRLRAEGLL